MKRVNAFRVVPRSDTDAECLQRLLDASASLWNEVNYGRRQHFADPDIDQPIWEADDHYGQYKGVVGSATAQQMIRKNDQAWRSFFALEEQGEASGLPGYWGNKEDDRELRTYIRNNQYTLRWATGTREQSILDVPVGKDLKDEYDIEHQERLRLDVRGKPKWSGKQCQLELFYDDVSDQFRAIQPVKNCSRQDSPLADETAALDIGANNIVACSTTTGNQFLYEGRELFDRFRETTDHIAELQSTVKCEEGQYSSKRIRRLYRKRARRRDHAQDALVRDLIERLHKAGVSTVYVGALKGVLDTHWSVEVNAKTHNFWAFRTFIDRLETTAEEYGITVEEESEADTTRECPECGEQEDTIRSDDDFWCPCGYEGHADLDASAKFLAQETNDEIQIGSMARPVRLKWNDHRWSESSRSPRSNEERTHQQKISVGPAA
jgi:putative transposase